MPREVVIFQHMAKTAGTSLRQVMLENYAPDEVMLLYRGDEATGSPPPRLAFEYRDWYRTLDPEARDRMRLVASHSANCLSRSLERPFRIVSLLRNPIDRVASFYSFMKWQATRGGRPTWERDVGDEIIRRGWSLADIYRNLGGAGASDSVLHNMFSEFFNGQARTVLKPWDRADELKFWAGEPDDALELKARAIELLSQQYVVGVQERFEESLQLYARTLGWERLSTPRLNVREPGALDPETRELVAAYNEIDAALHAHFEAALDRYTADSRASTPTARADTATARRGVQVSKPVAILGAPRSGTSLTTNLIGLLGVELGREDEMMASQPGQNPAGFWEHEGLVAVNEELLALISIRPTQEGQGWRDAVVPTGDWHCSASLAGLRVAAREQLASSFRDSPCWGWKDPRTSLTLPFWQLLIPGLRHVICVRHPLDVAASLRRRDGMQEEEALGLWLRYNVRAVSHTRGRPRLVLSYERWFTSWRTQLERLARFLNVSEDAGRPHVLATAEREVDPRLWHHRSTRDTLAEERLPEDVRALYAELERSAADADASALDELAADIDARLAAASWAPAPGGT